MSSTATLVTLYEEILAKVHEKCQQAHDETLPMIDKVLDETVEALSQQSQHQAADVQTVAAYVSRDLHDLSQFIQEAGNEVPEDWLSFDWKLAEDRTWEMFLSLADPTQVELASFNRRLENPGEYAAGEITGVGSLECMACGKRIHFYKADVIPVCDQCGNNNYMRIND